MNAVTPELALRTKALKRVEVYCATGTCPVRTVTFYISDAHSVQAMLCPICQTRLEEIRSCE